MNKIGRALAGAYSRVSSRVFGTAAIGLVALAGLGTAQAATISITCNQGTTYTLTNAVSGQCFTGNFDNTITNTTVMLAQTGWTMSDNTNSLAGSGVVNFSPGPVNGDKSGTWGLDSLAGYNFIAVILKAGNSFGAFLVDVGILPTAPTALWTSSKDLSHAGIYTTGTPVAVPVPAAGLLMLTALGSLGFLARRRRAS